MTVGEAAAWMVHDSRVQGLKGAFLRMPDASLPVVCVCLCCVRSSLLVKLPPQSEPFMKSVARSDK